MGESPIYSCHAHVFTIDPKTKKTWLPASGQAIRVSFFFDKTREQYRILSIDDAAQDLARKMPINSIMTEKMSFKKTSQKFGQWADTASNTVFGLGFANEAELDRFVEQFVRALDHTRQLRKQPHIQAVDGPLPVDLDDHNSGGLHIQQSGGDSSAVWRGEVDRLTGQLQQTTLSLQQMQRENQALQRARAAPSESDARVAQLEKENFMLKAKIKQLEDTVTQLDQQVKDAPALAGEVQRRLQEAAEFAGQLVRLTGPVGHKY